MDKNMIDKIKEHIVYAYLNGHHSAANVGVNIEKKAQEFAEMAVSAFCETHKLYVLEGKKTQD